MSVNADKLVRIIPRIISGGTAGLSFAGLVLTQSALAPAGAVLQFSSPKAVAAYGPVKEMFDLCYEALLPVYARMAGK